MDQVGFGTNTSFEVFDEYKDYATMLTAMDIYKLTGIIEEVVKTKEEVTVRFFQGSDDYEFGYDKDGEEDIDAEGSTAHFNLNGSNAADFAQNNVDVYVKKVAKGEYDILFVVPSEIGETLVINGKDLDPDKATVKADSAEKLQYKETKNATKYTKFDVKANATININGKSAAYTDGEFNLAAYPTKIEFVGNDDNDVFDIINITVYEHAIVEEVDAAKERITFVDDDSIRFDSEDKDQVVDIYNAAGEKIALEDIKAGDVLAMVVHGFRNGKVAPAKMFAAYGNEITIYNLGANTVTGKITEAVEDEALVYIDGKEYEVEDDFAYGKEDDVKLGAEGTFYLNIAGDIIGFDGSAGGNVNYAYVLQAEWNDTDAFAEGWQVKMLTADGIDTYDLYKSVKVNGEDYTTSTEIGEDFDFFVAFEGTSAWNPEVNVAEEDEEPEYEYTGNVVEFKLSTDGKIKEIASVDEEVAVDEAFNAVTNKLGGKLLADDVVIYDVTGDDADDVKIADLSLLVDDGEYAGYVLNNKDRDGFKVFVMTSGAAKFDPEVKYNVVSSKRTTKYDDDDAVIVNNSKKVFKNKFQPFLQPNFLIKVSKTLRKGMDF
jgi:predicted RNA-binding protein